MNVINPKCPSRAPRGTPTEQQEAIWLVEYARYRPWFQYLYHVPNEQPSGKRVHGAIARAMGVSAGYPDYGLDMARRGWHGLRIELKRTAGARLSEDQASWQQALLSEGYLSVVAHGWRVAACWLEWYAEPMPYTLYDSQWVPRRLVANRGDRPHGEGTRRVHDEDGAWNLAPEVV